MGSFVFIQQKLEGFIRKYYVNELIKGAILFFGIGLLYSIFLLSLEYFLWIGSFGRSIMFWSFVAVQVFLVTKYLVIPVFKLFKISRGIDYHQASRIIGNHFPEVNDKLLNVLQLQTNSQQSELLLASIEQKVGEMKAVPFLTAVDFRTNAKYLKFAVLPLVIISTIFFSGHINMFSDSYERVVNYKMAYEPPAPFSFLLLNDNLQVEENSTYILNVEAKGNIIPEFATIHYDDQTYYLEQLGPGKFQFTFNKINESIEFQISANGVNSRNYHLEVLKVPKMQNFEMALKFPAYTKNKDRIIKGTGNVTVPEGTKIGWKILTEATDNVAIILKDSAHILNKNGNLFTFEKIAVAGLPYQITTSNRAIQEYEKLRYEVKVIKDESPALFLDFKKDSLDGETLYFKGKVADDYGISAVKLAYFNVKSPENLKIINLNSYESNINEFIHVFPGNLSLDKGESYQLYFQVYDNDKVNGAKSVKSKIFDFRKRTDDEVLEERLDNQKESIEGMDSSIQKMEMSKKDMEELSRLQKEKKELDFSDRKKLKEYLDRQRRQEELLKNHQEKLKSNLEEKTGDNDFKKELEKRLDQNERKLEENEALRKEMEKYADKINKEELGKKLEQMSKQSSLQQKSMEQLLELTKRYYVQEKQKKLGEDLKKLTEKQEQLSKESRQENTKERQEQLSKEFEEFLKELKELKKENEGLRKPFEIPDDDKAEEEVKKEQEQAEEQLEKQNIKAAQEKQKKAAKKMKQMQEQMEIQMQSGSGEMMTEDAEMLRQILDNLVRFSFEQENLMETFRHLQPKSPEFSNKLKEQNILREHFKHVDDSIYSLALRNPMVTEKMLEKLTDIEFDINKSLERLADNEIPQAIGSQQYVVTGANDLALLLNSLLEQMQMQMAASGSGSGKAGGKGFQLPDVIKKQEELGEKMKQGIEKGQKGKSGEGQEKGKDGEKGNEDNGESGKGKRNEKEQGGVEGTEQMNGKLFEIYQQQQLLKQQLKERLEQDGFSKEDRNLIREMEQVEQDLLNKGFDSETLRKMQNIKHKLMELDKALLQQGEEEKRESKSNKNNYQNTTDDSILKAKEYFNSTEILNRQVLPLRHIYKIKVQEYFGVGSN